MSPGRKHVAVAALVLAILAGGCRLFERPWTPLPEHALATEGEDAGAAAAKAPEAAGEAPGAEHAHEGADDEPVADDGDARAVSGGATRYAALDRGACEAELDRRHIAYERVTEARGVVAPLRLTGPLGGVLFRSNLPPAKARTSPYDIYDCRLVLALDDFARILARYDIVEVIHLSVYRPVSSKVVLKGPGRRHSGALAIDAAIFKTKDGRALSVEKDFQPRRIGARPCPPASGATDLRMIACEAHDAHLFNVLLTPNYNWAHRNHFHLEVTAGVSWTLVR